MGSGGSKQKQKEICLKTEEVKKEYIPSKRESFQPPKPRDKDINYPNKPETVVQYKIQQPSKGDDENPNDSSVMGMDGLIKFLSDVGIDGEGVESLYLLFIMNTEQLNSIKSSEYNNLLKSAKVYTAQDAKSYIKAELKKVNESEEQFKKFMSFIFKASNVDNPMSKYITVDQCVPILELVSTSSSLLKNSSLIKVFIKYLNDSGLKGIKRDEWESIYYFFKQNQKDLSSYTADDAWPVIFDDFAEWMKTH